MDPPKKNADPNPDPDPGLQKNADPDPGIVKFDPNLLRKKILHLKKLFYFFLYDGKLVLFMGLWLIKQETRR